MRRGHFETVQVSSQGTGLVGRPNRPGLPRHPSFLQLLIYSGRALGSAPGQAGKGAEAGEEVAGGGGDRSCFWAGPWRAWAGEDRAGRGKNLY